MCVVSRILRMLEKFHVVISWVRTQVYRIPGDNLKTCLFLQGQVCVLWPAIQVLMSDCLRFNFFLPLGAHMTLGSYLNPLSDFYHGEHYSAYLTSFWKLNEEDYAGSLIQCLSQRKPWLNSSPYYLLDFTLVFHLKKRGLLAFKNTLWMHCSRMLWLWRFQASSPLGSL